MSDLQTAIAQLHRQDEEITSLRVKLEQAEARVAELDRDNRHQRERRNAARECIQKMKSETLRKQAEAVEKFGQEIGVFDPEYDDQGYVEIPRREVKIYAQRLRQQADELEKQQ